MVQPLRNNLKDSENLNSFRDIIRILFIQILFAQTFFAQDIILSSWFVLAAILISWAILLPVERFSCIRSA
jgi:hypothetical protein